MAQSGGEALNLLIKDSHGTQKVIKIRRTGNEPISDERLKQIIVQEYSQNSKFKLPVRKQQQSQSLLPHEPKSSHHMTSPITYGYKSDPVPTSSTATTTGMQHAKILPIKLTPQQMAALKDQSDHIIATKSQLDVDSPTPHTSSETNFISSPSIIPAKVKSSAIKRRRSDRVGKGLRHFSMKVCEKVKEKNSTTYNEVADELVQEVIEEAGDQAGPNTFDQKNIRRRVYDALNVLMAMDIISKDKKEIRWIGLPSNSAKECDALTEDIAKRRERIEAKEQQLRELILHQVSFKSLVTRNKLAEERGQVPQPNSAIQLPFIIVNTHKKTHINCSISNDKSDYFFKFDNKFSIHDDIEILKRMGLLCGLDTGECTPEDIKRAKKMVPKAFERYVEQYGCPKLEDRDSESESYVDMDIMDQQSSLKSEPQSEQEDDLIEEDNQYTDDDA